MSFTVTVHGTASIGYTLSINPSLILGPSSLPNASVGVTCNVQLTATGGTGFGYVFKATSLPAWLTLSASGLLSGTPINSIGSPFVFTVTLTDSAGDTTN